MYVFHVKLPAYSHAFAYFMNSSPESRLIFVDAHPARKMMLTPNVKRGVIMINIFFILCTANGYRVTFGARDVALKMVRGSP